MDFKRGASSITVRSSAVVGTGVEEDVDVVGKGKSLIFWVAVVRKEDSSCGERGVRSEGQKSGV